MGTPVAEVGLGIMGLNFLVLFLLEGFLIEEFIERKVYSRFWVRVGIILQRTGLDLGEGDRVRVRT